MSDATDTLDGYHAIAEALTAAFGPGAPPISEDAAYRLATRERHPLPVDGYQMRVWISRAALVEWVAAERRRRGRGGESTGASTRQLGLFGATEREPR